MEKCTLVFKNETLTYYQKRLKLVEGNFQTLKKKVENFVESVTEED